MILLAWLAIGGLGGPYAGKLAKVATNDAAAFLPASAESTRAGELAKAFDGVRSLPAVIVADRADRRLTATDTAFLEAAARSVPTSAGIVGPVSPPVISADGEAAELVAPVSASADPTPAVKAIRDVFSNNTPAGLRVLVTGPAGQIADLSKAFGGIDTTLLLVTALLVTVILLVVYRSPMLPLIVVISAVLGLSLASSIVYALAKTHTVTLNGQSQGIMFILVFGAATDYALLLIARFREELANTDDRFTAMRRAWRAVLAPIAASATTVILGVLCLLLSDLNSNRSLGPVAAIGIAAALIASLTFLPAVLALAGRPVFWPLAPKPAPAQQTGGWRRVASVVTAHRTAVWLITGLSLTGCAAFVPQLKSSGTAQSAVFLTQVGSVAGQRVLGDHFPAGSGSPTIVVADAAHAEQVAAATAAVPGVNTVAIANIANGSPRVVDGRVQIQATLADPADSPAALATVGRIRNAVHAIPWAGALVGGPTATQLDTQTTAARDRAVIIPIVLFVVFVVLAVLLRALLAPLLLIATVVLSFAATLGVAALMFNHVFHFPGSDPAVPLFGFVFLVALGVDYNIFLMTRVREETTYHGPTMGIQRGLAVTGGVITSAGIVLAATFGALTVIPLLFLAQLAFIVAFGVLLDTLVVRSLLVPALALQIGPVAWWPSALARQKDPHRNALSTNGIDHDDPIRSSR
ncbi:MMPL family transporter [Mycobacterium heckeshornense]|uniref:Membrane protein n=1 Tax=Mycobacterium heckeshornense TaxID=110505 RepID=A0A7R7JHC4_9MYCO|nr:MMPL family transporter [Mycobacterium heckeshornense]BCO35735.1 membrane protein [Mycobacterium heckeshornense]